MSVMSKEGDKAAHFSRAIISLLAFGALVVIVGAAALVFLGGMPLGTAKLVMLIETVIWFIAAPFWLLRGDSGDDA